MQNKVIDCLEITRFTQENSMSIKIAFFFFYFRCWTAG